MAKRAPASDDFDSPWKEALQRYLRSFLLFFWPDIHGDVDWARGYESLDKEFQQIIRRTKTGKRLADKLFKIWLKDGVERWLLVHIEVQGAYEKDFARRMFDYNVAAWQLHGKTVVSLAVLCDDRPEWRPNAFTYGQWGCKMELSFRVAKLLDHAGDVAVLEASDNPFAAIVLAHLQALATHGDPATRQQWKRRIIKGLYRGHWSKEDVRELFRLIDWIMTLPEDLDEALRTEIHEFEEEQKMPYITSFERLAKKEGREEGREEGRDALLESIEIVLESKFGSSGRKLVPKVRALGSVDELRRFVRFLKNAKSIDQARSRLSE
ncbi:MAG: hypothetical protein L0Y72_18455 [Gemmataceae bacterium]|nr:hypothetical protein [Gemmataceae bacterium]MCI0741034.1 hypothetical protein [Gemmataceae bacterium]